MSSPAPPIDANVIASLDPIRLAGARCAECGTTTFPAQADCPRCARRTMNRIELPAEGVLWTWTTQTFQPKAPYAAPSTGFEPFPVGYVDLGDVIVEARLEADPEALRVGTRMRLVPLTLLVDGGQPVIGYAFAPATGGSA
ncbi:Zn-ribbon domain-containing OB-fold protein [Prauserella endophytica]|uniref:Zn-ribbon domain-containing OB-fold protein n=1 Tax=Prauserella endophytica TaxID=1592324 RepID=UPI00197F0D2A|nr:OB-fold domain-containing protein [Prauserella endophytica]